MKKVELLIIGAGPAGISLATEARMAGMDADQILMIDKAETHSWVIRSLYPDKKLVTANYKGQKAVCHGVMCLLDSTKDETISYLDEAIRKNGVTVKYKEEVLSIDTKGSDEAPLFWVQTNTERYEAKIVVIAIGIFGKPNKPDYKLSRKLKNRIHFDITSFRSDKENILIVGGGDSASEFAQYLIEKGNTVTLSYRRDSFGRMNSFNLDVITRLEQNKQVKVLFGSNIEEVSISEREKPFVHFKEDQFEDREYDRIVYALGGTTPTNFLKLTGIQFEGESPHLSHDGESSIPGLFIAGDLLAGKKGGSIAHAFNASRATMSKICENYLECKIE